MQVHERQEVRLHVLVLRDLSMVVYRQLHVVEGASCHRLVVVHDVVADPVLRDIAPSQPRLQLPFAAILLPFCHHLEVYGTRRKVGHSWEGLQDLLLSEWVPLPGDGIDVEWVEIAYSLFPCYLSLCFLSLPCELLLCRSRWTRGGQQRLMCLVWAGTSRLSSLDRSALPILRLLCGQTAS